MAWKVFKAVAEKLQGLAPLFPSLLSHCLFARRPEYGKLSSHVFSFFFFFLVVSGKRINPVPITPSWLEAEVIFSVKI